MALMMVGGTVALILISGCIEEPQKNNTVNTSSSYNNPVNTSSSYNNPVNTSSSYNNPVNTSSSYNNPINTSSSYNNPVNTSSSDIFFPIQKNPTNVCMTALLSGKPEELVIDKDGCLRAGGRLLIWPYGFSLKNESGLICVIDDTGQLIALVGDKVEMGGGETPGAHEWSRCPGPYFIVCKYDIKVI